MPNGFAWLWGHFLEIWNSCEYDFNGNRIITPRTINDYQTCFMVPFSIYEKRLLIKMKNWALNEISDLKESGKINKSDNKGEVNGK